MEGLLGVSLVQEHADVVDGALVEVLDTLDHLVEGLDNRAREMDRVGIVIRK